MEDGLTLFLMNKDEDYTLYKMNEQGNYFLRKESVPENDRFQIIYYKEVSKRLDFGYEYGGIYDTQTQKVYGLHYPLSMGIPKNSKVKSVDFGEVEYEMSQNFKKDYNEYIIKNKDNLKKYGLDSYRTLQSYQYERYKNEVNRIFIKSDEPKIDYDFSTHVYDLYGNNSERIPLLLKYLTEPDKTIKESVSRIIDDKKESIGFDILIKDEQEKYLKELINNKGNKFNDIYLNKKIYESIKYTYANKINITIEYGGKQLTFRFDYEKFLNSLSNSEKSISDYRNNYFIVSNFIKENGHCDKYNKSNNDFEFDHILSIKYGKKELYNSSNFKPIEKEKNNNREER